VKLARLKLSKSYAELTPPMAMVLIAAHSLNPFRNLQYFRKWDKWTDINPKNKTSYTIQYHTAILKDVENEHFAKHRSVPVNTLQSLLSSNSISSTTTPGSFQSSFDPYDLSSDDKAYLTPNNVAEIIPRQCNRTACILTAGRLYLKSPPAEPKHWGQIHPNLNDNHSDPMECSSTYWKPDSTDWLWQQEETPPKYTDHSIVVCNIFPIIPPGGRVEDSFSWGRDVIGRRHSKTTYQTLRDHVVGRQFTEPNHGILAGTDPEFDTTNTEQDWEMKKEEEERNLHRIA